MKNLVITDELFFEVSQRNKGCFNARVHIHDVYEIYYLDKGNINYFIDGDIYNVRAGDFVLIRPGVVHTTKYDTVEYKRFLINVKEEYLKEFLMIDSSIFDVFKSVHIRLLKHENEHARDILLRLQHEFERENPSEVLKKCLMGELLYLLARSGEEMPSRAEGDDNMKLIAEYINENYNTDLTLEGVAKKFFQNSAYFSRCFKKKFGTGFKEYLTNIRMAAAVELLKDSDLNITQIAYRVGYNSQNHFCKTFKSEFGMSPLQYRKVL